MERGYLLFLILTTFCLTSHGGSVLFMKPASNISNCPNASNPCLTLTEYLELGNDSFSSFIFLDGYHILDTDFTIADLVNVSLRADSNASVSIDCGGQSRFLFNNVSGLVIENIAFISCGISSLMQPLPGISLHNLDQAELVNITITNSSSGALYIQGSNVTIMNILIHKNRINVNGTFSGMMVENSSVYFQANNTFSQNGLPFDNTISISCLLYFGDFYRRLYFERDSIEAVFLAVNTELIADGTLTVTNNTSPSGIMIFQNSSFEMSGEGQFTGNSVCVSGALFLCNARATFSGNLSFSRNFANERIFNAVSGIRIESTSLVEINGTVSFSNNVGDVSSMIVHDSQISILGSFVTIQNYAYVCVSLLSSNLMITGSPLFLSNVARRSVLNANDSRLIASGNTSFVNNTGSLSSIVVTNTYILLNGSTTFADNNGVLYALSSNVHLTGESNFAHNLGSIVVMFQSGLRMVGKYIFDSNSVRNGNGGAIYASDSFVIFAGYGTFRNNTARNGGALYLLLNSRVGVEPGALISFEQNTASVTGGAINVVDTVSYDECTNVGVTSSLGRPLLCFVNFGAYNQDNTTRLRFLNNTAKIGGSVLHGGMLDKCTLNPPNEQSALDIFKELSVFGTANTSPVISSEPYILCFCENDVAACSRTRVRDMNVIKGQRFSVSVIAFSQTRNGTSGLIRSYLGFTIGKIL